MQMIGTSITGRQRSTQDLLSNMSLNLIKKIVKMALSHNHL